jgi:hypothetical protein
MKSTDFKKLIKEAVREAIQEELKDILLEAVKSPKQVVHTQHLDVVQGDNNKVLDKVYIKELSNKLISIYKLKVGVINKVERVMTDSDREVMLSLVEMGLTEELWSMIVDETLANCQTSRREPPHRIAYFKEAIQRVLNTD